MPEQATVVIATAPGAVVVTVAGEVDMSNVRHIAGSLQEAVDPTLERHVVDLSQTTYLDSVGIRLLFTFAEDLQVRRLELHLVVPEGSPLRSLLALAGVEKLVPMHATLQDALAVQREDQ